MTVFFVSISLILLFSYLIYKRHKRICNELPPGPPTMPILGSFFYLNFKNGNADAVLDKDFYKFNSDMYTVWLGSIPLIVIQNFNLAKDLFAREEFCGRPNGYHDTNIRGKDGRALGIVATMGLFWQEQRRFTLKHLKELGFGRQKIEYFIHEECKYLIDDLSCKSLQGDVLFDTLFNFPIINILWQIVASKKYEPDLPESKKMMQKVTQLFQAGIPVLDFLMAPLRHRLPLLKEDKMTLDLKALFQHQVQQHVKENKIHDFHGPQNFIDIYLKEIHEQQISQQQGAEEQQFSSFNLEQLATICLDLFQAGSETSSTTLTWAVMYLTLYPNVQEKCRKEIDEHLGGK